jgi:hypothetical protein
MPVLMRVQTQVLIPALMLVLTLAVVRDSTSSRACSVVELAVPPAAWAVSRLSVVVQAVVWVASASSAEWVVAWAVSASSAVRVALRSPCWLWMSMSNRIWPVSRSAEIRNVLVKGYRSLFKRLDAYLGLPLLG